MSSFGVDRYGRPRGMDQQAAGTSRQPRQNNPSATQPQQNQPSAQSDPNPGGSEFGSVQPTINASPSSQLAGSLYNRQQQQQASAPQATGSTQSVAQQYAPAASSMPAPVNYARPAEAPRQQGDNIPGVNTPAADTNTTNPYYFDVSKGQGNPYYFDASQGDTTPGSEKRAPDQPGLAPAAPAGQQYKMGGGFDQGKLSDPTKGTSEKYAIGRVMQQFDPKLGVTPQMLAALNALGIAEFSGSGDQLSVKNTKNDPRFGVGGTSDVVQGLKGQNGDTAWQPWFVDDRQGAPQQAMPGPMSNVSASHALAGQTYNAGAMGAGVADGAQSAMPGPMNNSGAGGASGDQQSPQAAASLLQQILNNPHSMNEGNVAMLKSRQAEEAMQMQQQLAAQGNQRALAHGTLGGGANAAAQSRLAESMANSVMSGNQEVDLAKMQQDRQDELGAFGAWMNQDAANRDSTRISNQNSQFNLSNDLANRSFADQMKQWRAMLNYQYQNSANSSNQNPAG